MKSTIIIFTTLLISYSSFVNAIIINSENTSTEYASGYHANLQDLDWLSWDITYDYSRSSIESGVLNLLNEGWRYATVTEFDTLFSSLRKGVQSGGAYQQVYSEGTKWLWETFDNPHFLDNFGIGIGDTLSRTGSLYYGSDLECHADNQISCRGNYRAYDNGHGWMLTKFHDGSEFDAKNSSRYTYSSVLVRPSAHIPEPSISALLGLGFLGIYVIRRKNNSSV